MLLKSDSAGTRLMGGCHPGIDTGAPHGHVLRIGSVGSATAQRANAGRADGRGCGQRIRPRLGWEVERNQIIRSFRSHVENWEFYFLCNRKPLKDSKWEVGST